MAAAPHASIVGNQELRDFLARHRTTLRNHCLEVFRAHRRVPVGTQYNQGLKHGPFSLGLNASIHPLLQQLLNAFAEAFPNYELYTPELFFGTGKPVRAHNDVSLFLRSGQEVPIQLWVLLESCIMSPTGATDTARRNALEVGLPVAPGPVYAGTSYSLSPAGKQPVAFKKTVGGDDLEIGDTLLFRNGCVHFTRAVKQPGLFRVALALRAIRRDRQEDDNYLRWMKQLWATDENLAREARGTYVSSAQRMFLDAVDDEPPDPTRLTKIDANDYTALSRAIERIDPANSIAAPINYIDLRTAQSLER